MSTSNVIPRPAHLLMATLAAAASSLLAACVSPAATLYSALVSDSAVRVERGVRFGAGARDQLDIYHPANDPAPAAPIIFFVYGGSWRDGDRAMYGFAGSALAARGYTTVIADYRLFPEVRFPGFVQDSARAYRWTHDTLTRSPVGVRPIVVAGHSAGAHTAALLAADRSYLTAVGAPPPAAFIGLAGPYAFDPTTWPTTKDVFAGARSADSTRPVAFAGPHVPPALLMHGTADDTVKLFNQRDFAKALAASGVPVRAREIPEATHAGLVLALSRPFRRNDGPLDEITRFLQANFPAP